MPEIKLVIPCSLAEIGALTKRVIVFLDDHKVPRTAGYCARVAVEELVVNVIRYAFDDDRLHDIGVGLRLNDGRIVVTVEDDGSEFDPTAVPEPDLSGDIHDRSVGGWGIYLVRNLSKGFTYERRGGRNRVQAVIPLDVKIG